MKWIAATCVACACLVAGTAYAWLRRGDRPMPPIPPAQPAGTAPTEPAEPRAAALHRARRSCDTTALDAFVAEQSRLVEAAPTDAVALRVLAEALLERVQLRNQRRGMVPGQPLYDAVPADVQSDVDRGLELLDRARRAGDDSADCWRLEASLLGNRIVGFTSALQWNGRIEAAIETAYERDSHHPALHVVLGLRKLLAPVLFGQDPAKALEHLEFAAAAMPDDERPDVFAAMAAFLLKKRQQAIALLERAVAKNPKNVFATAVLERVRRGEDEPFGRDVDAK